MHHRRPRMHRHGRQFLDNRDLTAVNEPVEEPDAPKVNDGLDHKIDYSDIDFAIETNDKHDDDGYIIVNSLDIFDAAVHSIYRTLQSNAKELGVEIILERVSTENKHKWVVTGFPRNIDIFHVNDVPSVIVKFHLGCVRAWYDGDRVHCFPSFVTAAKIGLNMDIRWTSNRKDVRDTVLKYHQRGFGTLLNFDDKKSLVRYVDEMSATGVWPRLTSTEDDMGGGWRRRRRWLMMSSRAMFKGHEGLIFNPSMTRTGIHYDISSEGNPIDIASLAKSARKEVRKNATPEFKAKKQIVLPSSCGKLAAYL